MSEDKKIETHNVSAPATKSDSSSKFAEINTGKDGFPSISVSSAVNATSKIDATGQPLTSEQGVSYPPTSCYDYYYPVRLWSSKLNANLVCYKSHNYHVWDVQAQD